MLTKFVHSHTNIPSGLLQGLYLVIVIDNLFHKFNTNLRIIYTSKLKQKKIKLIDLTTDKLQIDRNGTTSHERSRSLKIKVIVCIEIKK